MPAGFREGFVEADGFRTAVLFEPGEELAGSPEIGHAGVFVADRICSGPECLVRQLEEAPVGAGGEQQEVPPSPRPSRHCVKIELKSRGQRREVPATLAPSPHATPANASSATKGGAHGRCGASSDRLREIKDDSD